MALGIQCCGGKGLIPVERPLAILVLSSLYPPHYIGGYELGCRDVVDHLRSRGHDVRVLASTYGVDRPQVDGHVYRWLRIELKPLAQDSVRHQWALFRKEWTNRRALKRVLQQFQPDLVYVWSIHHASLSLVRMAQQLGLPITAFVSDHWLAAWPAQDAWSFMPRHPLRWLIRRALGAGLAGLTGTSLPGDLQLTHVQFASAFLRDLTLPGQPKLTDPQVIHWGIDPNLFLPGRTTGGPGTRLLYVGQIAEHKGVHTALEALALLTRQDPGSEVSLTLVGGAVFPTYPQELQQQVVALDLSDRVRWVGMVPRAELPAIYAAHDILIFPSLWDEPFSITVLEAMASGLAVVATATGGTPEIIIDAENGLLFPRADSAACAACLQRLLDSPELREEIARRGQQLVLSSFTIRAMIDRLEAGLEQVVSTDAADRAVERS
jgi:glycogen synthase